MRTPEQAEQIAKKVVEEKFPSALVAFCAGSIVRGEGTDSSDIDLVVVHSQLKRAYRESFLFEGCPIEAFVHDPSTLKYFFTEMDAKSGTPSLPQMVVEGIAVWGSEGNARQFKEIAAKLIAAGPAPLSEEDISNRIYGITDLVDDFKSPRSRIEAIGIATRLYESLGDFALRSQNQWSGAGKQIPRALQRYSPGLAEDFNSAFESFFAKNDRKPILDLAEKLTQPFGGFLFDDYKRDAPQTWRDNWHQATGKLHHVEIYVSDLEKSTQFWSWLLCEHLGYHEFQKWDGGLSYKLGDTYIVFVQTEERFLETPYHRCHVGLNHLAFHGKSREHIDELTQELEKRDVTILYKDKHPHAGGSDSYMVFFEDPDRIKVEVVAP